MMGERWEERKEGVRGGKGGRWERMWGEKEGGVGRRDG